MQLKWSAKYLHGGSPSDFKPSLLFLWPLQRDSGSLDWKRPTGKGSDDSWITKSPKTCVRIWGRTTAWGSPFSFLSPRSAGEWSSVVPLVNFPSSKIGGICWLSFISSPILGSVPFTGVFIGDGQVICGVPGADEETDTVTGWRGGIVILGPLIASEWIVGADWVTVCVILAIADKGAGIAIIPLGSGAAILETLVMAGLVMKQVVAGSLEDRWTMPCCWSPCIVE